ncbi:MAG: DUF4369 domain-containing protein [Marinifilaceae bacterium]
MKLRLSFLLLLLFPLCSALTAQNRTFKLQGMIGGIKDKTIYLIKDTGEGQELLDSTQTINGMFEFKGETDQPFAARIKTAKYHYLPVYLSPTEMDLLVHKDSIRNKLVPGCLSGSPAQNQYEDYVSKKNAAQKRQLEVSNILDTLNGTQYPQKKKALLEEYKQLSRFEMNYILKHATSPVAQHLIYKGLFDRRLHSEDIYKLLDTVPANYNSIYVKNLRKRLDMKERMSLGGQFPDIKTRTLTDGNFDLEAMKGKNVLLYIWRAWNSDTEKEHIAELRKLVNQYPKENLEIVSIVRYSSRRLYFSKSMKKQAYIPKPQLQGLCTEIPSCDGELDFLRYMNRSDNVFLLNPQGIVVFNRNQKEPADLINLLNKL